MHHVQTLARHGFRIGTGLFDPAPAERIALPFRRSRLALLAIGSVALIMTVPAVQTFGEAARSWGELGGLFDLTTALFLTGWLLGWSAGLLFLYGLFGILWYGRETLVLRPGVVEIRFGLPLLFLRVRLDPARIRDLRHHVPAGDRTSWRGPHLAFDYAGTRMEVGSDLSPASAGHLSDLIRALPASCAANPPIDYLAIPQARATTADVTDAVPHEPARARPRNATVAVSSLVLVAANLVPVAGVLLSGWDLGGLMVLFWAESGIIGLYHLLRMAVVQRWAVLFSGPLFVGHFGAFMAMHFLFVYELFVAGQRGMDSSLAELGQYLLALWPGLLALLLSHGLSFVYNFLGRAEYRGKRARGQMGEPYGRIMIMHVTVILGGGLSLVLGSPAAALLLLVVLKVAADLTAHRKQHRPPSPGPDPG